MREGRASLAPLSYALTPSSRKVPPLRLAGRLRAERWLVGRGSFAPHTIRRSRPTEHSPFAITPLLIGEDGFGQSREILRPPLIRRLKIESGEGFRERGERSPALSRRLSPIAAEDSEPARGYGANGVSRFRGKGERSSPFPPRNPPLPLPCRFRSESHP